MERELRDNEIIEELEGGIRIIANTVLYRYTSDSVRLAKAVRASRRDRILDLCSGGGVVALMLAYTTTAERIDGIEIQRELSDMASRSVELNSLQDRVHMICGDLVGFDGGQRYDIVVCNPPYYRIESGSTRSAHTCDIARHELRCTLNDIVTTYGKALKYGGVGYMVHKCERLSEVLTAMSVSGLEPKELTFYHSGDKPCDTFVLKVKKGACAGMTVKCAEL